MNKKLLKKIRCLICIKKKKFSSLYKKKKILICKHCGEAYPLFQNFPVILSSQSDFNHLRNALLPSKYRINYKWK
jgi:uncharacterized protein YbaR (Trm112 family)